MSAVARYPDSTKASLEQRLRARARDRWPQIASLHIRHRGTFSYVNATLADGTTLKLCRLRYVGSASQWQFAISTAPATTTTTNRSSPPAPAKTPSTPPAASTSTTPLPGSNPRRTYRRDPLAGCRTGTEGGEFAEPGPVQGRFGSLDAGPFPRQHYPESAGPDGAADRRRHHDRLAVDADRDLGRLDGPATVRTECDHLNWSPFGPLSWGEFRPPWVVISLSSRSGGIRWDDCPRRCPARSAQPVSCTAPAALPLSAARSVTCCRRTDTSPGRPGRADPARRPGIQDRTWPAPSLAITADHLGTAPGTNGTTGRCPDGGMLAGSMGLTVGGSDEARPGAR